MPNERKLSTALTRSVASSASEMSAALPTSPVSRARVPQKAPSPDPYWNVHCAKTPPQPVFEPPTLDPRLGIDIGVAATHLLEQNDSKCDANAAIEIVTRNETQVETGTESEETPYAKTEFIEADQRVALSTCTTHSSQSPASSPASRRSYRAGGSASKSTSSLANGGSARRSSSRSSAPRVSFTLSPASSQRQQQQSAGPPHPLSTRPASSKGASVRTIRAVGDADAGSDALLGFCVACAGGMHASNNGIYVATPRLQCHAPVFASVNQWGPRLVRTSMGGVLGWALVDARGRMCYFASCDATCPPVLGWRSTAPLSADNSMQHLSCSGATATATCASTASASASATYKATPSAATTRLIGSVQQPLRVLPLRYPSKGHSNGVPPCLRTTGHLQVTRFRRAPVTEEPASYFWAVITGPFLQLFAKQCRPHATGQQLPSPSFADQLFLPQYRLRTVTPTDVTEAQAHGCTEGGQENSNAQSLWLEVRARPQEKLLRLRAATHDETASWGFVLGALIGCFDVDNSNFAGDKIASKRDWR